MKATCLAGAILLLLSGHALAEFNEVTFGGRKLTQSPRSRRRIGRPTGAPTQGRPRPVGGGDAESWEIVRSGEVKGAVPRVFDIIEDPTDALVFAFEDLVFSSRDGGIKLTILELNSGEEMTIEHIRTGFTRPGLFHLFQIKSHTDGILKADGQSIDISGSQFFIQLKGIIQTEVEVGWITSVSPASAKTQISNFFGGIVEEMVDRFKAVFIGDDCIKFGLDAVFRDITGTCNNIDKTYGAVNAPLKRVTGADFGDGASSFGGSDINARKISNIVAKEDSSSDDGSNARGATDMFVFFGQFIDHDIGISPVGAFASKNQPLFSTSFEKFNDEVPIEIPSNDPDFTGGKKELPFERAVFVRKDNQEVFPRQIVNQITSYLDLSQVYGSTPSRTNALRTNSNGLMKTSGSGFLPKNGAAIGISLENAPDASSRFHVAGDIRANENVNLLALHTVWLREHNKVAGELKSKFPRYSDEQLFQTARAICTAEYQSILYTEWLPVILGGDSPSASGYSYSAGVDASADAFFTTASFRFGHSMINGKMWRVNAGSKTASSVKNLREVFFNPEELSPGNIDSWIRGMAWHQAREADEKVIDDLRSFLFTEDGRASQDLVALNIQRARDMGVPTYNKARASFGLSRKSSFSSISSSAASKLEEAYEGNVDAVDAFIGGLAETKKSGRMFGDLFHESIKEQFRRLRDGDRFFYKGLSFDFDVGNRYPRINDIIADKVKFLDVLVRNTGVSRSDIGRGVFTL